MKKITLILIALFLASCDLLPQDASQIEPRSDDWNPDRPTPTATNPDRYTPPAPTATATATNPDPRPTNWEDNPPTLTPTDLPGDWPTTTPTPDGWMTPTSTLNPDELTLTAMPTVPTSDPDAGATHEAGGN